MTNGGEAVSHYHQQGVLVSCIADVYKVANGTENTIQARNPTYLNNYYLYTQFYAVNYFNCRCVNMQIFRALLCGLQIERKEYFC